MPTIKELVDNLAKITDGSEGGKETLTESAMSATVDYVSKMKQQFNALESGEPVKEETSSGFRSMIKSLTTFNTRPVKEEAEMDADEECSNCHEDPCVCDDEKEETKESYKKAYDKFSKDERKVSECIASIASLMEEYIKEEKKN